MILGITGGIATGKSRVARMFEELGAVVISADALAREVVLPGSPLLNRLVERFGAAILTSEGGLDRRKLGDAVFSDEEARRDLNGLIHPAIRTLAEARLQEAAAAAPLVVYEAPLLFEAGAEGRVDAVLVVTASEEVQLQRLMARDALSEADARRRMDAQMPLSEKIARSDYVIDNSGLPGETKGRVEELFHFLSEGKSGGRGEKKPSPRGEG